MRCLLEGGVYFTFSFPNAAFIGRGAFKRENKVFSASHAYQANLIESLSLDLAQYLETDIQTHRISLEPWLTFIQGNTSTLL